MKGLIDSFYRFEKGLSTKWGSPVFGRKKLHHEGHDTCPGGQCQGVHKGGIRLDL
jgi:hypothetical protein